MSAGYVAEIVGGPHDGLCVRFPEPTEAILFVDVHDPITGHPGLMHELPVSVEAGRLVLRWDDRDSCPVTG